MNKKKDNLDIQIRQVEQKIERLQLHLENLQRMKELKQKQAASGNTEE